MIDDKSIDDLCVVVDCTYKGERYSARNDGSIFRHARTGGRARSNDGQWTLGKLDNKTGYMQIASVRVHRIVATAFHGAPPTKEHVVDHIDTNRRNNRPENLRWVTRLENVLFNPITAKRIEIVCGSIEAFLAEPSKFKDRFQKHEYKWMSAVSIQEANLSLERMLAWAKSDKYPSGGTLGEWIFNRSALQKADVKAISTAPEITRSKSSNAMQCNWHVPSEFPCCPQEYSEKPLMVYAENLKAGAVFCQNDIYSLLALECAISDEGQSIYVICESVCREGAIKPWTLAKITYENELFLHTSLQSFFTQQGVKKQYHLAQGLEWLGEDTFDDNC